MGDLEEEEPQLEALPYQEEWNRNGQDRQDPPELEGTFSEAQLMPPRSDRDAAEEDELLSAQEEAREEAEFDRMLEEDIKAAERCDPLGTQVQRMEQERQLATSVRREVDQELWKELDDFEGQEEEATRVALLQEQDATQGSTTEEEGTGKVGVGAPRRAPQVSSSTSRPKPKSSRAKAASAGDGGPGGNRRQGSSPDGEQTPPFDRDSESLEMEEEAGADEVYQKELEASLEDHLCHLRIEEQAQSDALMEAASDPLGPERLPGSPNKPRGKHAYGSGDIAGGE